jgi:CDGSH-type Zn-finger protein
MRARGPFMVEGPFELLDASGEVLDLEGRTVVALCRCGSSRSKPFCDGCHNRIGFEAPVEPAPTDDPPDGR